VEGLLENIAGHHIVRPLAALPGKACGTHRFVSTALGKICQRKHDITRTAIGYGIDL
jgi:hypothetical protein